MRERKGANRGEELELNLLREGVKRKAQSQTYPARAAQLGYPATNSPSAASPSLLAEGEVWNGLTGP